MIGKMHLHADLAVLTLTVMWKYTA